MSEHCGYVTRIKNLRKIEGADRLLTGECYGNSVVVDLSYNDDELGVYFPIDLQLDFEFASKLNLLRKKDEQGNNIGGYLDERKRNIKAVKLRGVRSEGVFLHLDSFKDGIAAMNPPVVGEWKEGDTVGSPVCHKYIPKINKPKNTAHNKEKKKRAKADYPYFIEHVDTEQLNYNLDAFEPCDLIEITLKMHGTSGRSALSIKKEQDNSFIGKIKRLFGKNTEKVSWSGICGTRRCLIHSFNNDGGYYGTDVFRKEHHDKIMQGLHKGEEIFYEIVGWVNNGVTIMPSTNNKKLNDKAFVREYGDTTVFDYGCERGKSDIYVYRMTMTNEDGFTVEYDPDFMRYRCEQMGLKCVPVLWRGFIPNKWELECLNKTAGEWVKDVAERYYDGPDPVGKTHIREGVVARILNRPSFTAYKTKNFNFKVLSGIAVEQISEKELANYSDDILSEV